MWACSCQNTGLHSGSGWALMLCSRVFFSGWLSFCRLTCCYFEADCCWFFSLPLLQFPLWLRASFFQSIHELLHVFGPQDAGSQQIGFLLGSCGVTLALTTDACQKGLPKAQTGEVATFKGTECSLFWLYAYIISLVWKWFQESVSAGWPRLLWFVTDGKHVVKPPKDWHPPIRDASNDIAYIEVVQFHHTSMIAFYFPFIISVSHNVKTTRELNNDDDK